MHDHKYEILAAIGPFSIHIGQIDRCRLLSAGFADGEIFIGVRYRDYYSSLRIAFPGAAE